MLSCEPIESVEHEPVVRVEQRSVHAKHLPHPSLHPLWLGQQLPAAQKHRAAHERIVGPHGACVPREELHAPCHWAAHRPIAQAPRVVKQIALDGCRDQGSVVDGAAAVAGAGGLGAVQQSARRVRHREQPERVARAVAPGEEQRFVAEEASAQLRRVVREVVEALVHGSEDRGHEGRPGSSCCHQEKAGQDAAALVVPVVHVGAEERI
mmetsp:Transcript_16554/g.52788  ORF Transcript_16554/g.52788 Transcript_16554/m.52788 type:complete len:209 (-) Transcript_16554:2324-2950(-)